MSSCQSTPFPSSSCHSRDNSRFLRDYAATQINVFLWISLIVVTLLLLRKLLKLFALWAKGSRISGPPCPSFHGHSKLISETNLTDLLSESHNKYGSVVKLWLGPAQLLVSIKDPVLIKEMLLKAEDKLPLTGRAFRLAFGPSSLFSSSFDKVQKRRELLAAELNGYLLQRANVISIKVVDHVMEKLHAIMGKGTLDCKMVSQHMAFSIMGATLFGDMFLAWSKASVYEELLMMIAKDACFWASYSVTPFWKQGFWRYQRLCIKLKSLTQDGIEQCRQNYKLFSHMDQNSNSDITNPETKNAPEAPFSSSILMPDDLSLQEHNGHLNAREEPCGNIMRVMFHGCLTTAGLIGNILARLATHPEIQEKAPEIGVGLNVVLTRIAGRENGNIYKGYATFLFTEGQMSFVLIYSEIIMSRKGAQKQKQQNVDKMPFLLATVYESARLMPGGPLLQRCSLKHDLNLKTGLTIPAGAILVVPVQLVQMDDSCWGNDASQFNPYRFLSKAVKGPELVHVSSLAGTAEDLVDPDRSPCILDDPNHNAAFLPFGSGTRACVGQKFVILGVATLFASLLEHYEIRLHPGSEDNPKPMMNNCVLQLLPSPKIVLVRRNS